MPASAAASGAHASHTWPRAPPAPTFAFLLSFVCAYSKRKHEKLATLLSKKLHDKVANTLKMWGCHLLEKVAVLGVLGPCFLREQDVDSYACVLRCRQAWFLLTSSDPFLAFIQYLYKNQC